MRRSTRSGRGFSSPTVSTPRAKGRRSSRLSSGTGTPTRSATPGNSATPGGQSHRSISTLGNVSHCSSSTDGENDSVTSVNSLVQGSTAAGSATSSRKYKNHARTNIRGIDLPYQKLLFEDINNFGGLENAVNHITIFCDQAARSDSTRERFYGAARSKERFRVENKIRSWSKLPAQDLQELLRDLQVVVKRDSVESRSAFPSLVAFPDPAPSSLEFRNSKATPSKKSLNSSSRKAGGSEKKSGGSSKKSGQTVWQYREPKPVFQSSDEEDQQKKPPAVAAAHRQEPSNMSRSISILDGVKTGKLGVCQCWDATTTGSTSHCSRAPFLSFASTSRGHHVGS